jgi:ferritin-like metal-binding protein YciE
MANDAMETFVKLLSHARQTTDRSNTIYEELAKVAENDQIKDALNARSFIRKTQLEKIDEAFRLIGQKPVELTGKIQEVFVEDFRREVAELKSPLVKKIFVLAKAIHLAHWRVGEWKALVAASDFTGNYAVGALLETCLADDLAFAERTRRILRKMAEAKIAERAAGA